MNYDNRLKQIRLSKGLTIKQVADRMGKQCEDRISEWEQGLNMPSVVRLFAFYSATLVAFLIIDHKKLILNTKRIGVL